MLEKLLKMKMIRLFLIAAFMLLLLILPTKIGNIKPVIDSKLIKAIIKVESSGNPKAKSKKGAWGLMQVRHQVWTKELKEKGIIKTKHDLLHPKQNIQAGHYILTKYLRQTNCLRRTLYKYSGGSKTYYKKVMEAMDGE